MPPLRDYSEIWIGSGRAALGALGIGRWKYINYDTVWYRKGVNKETTTEYGE